MKIKCPAKSLCWQSAAVSLLLASLGGCQCVGTAGTTVIVDHKPQRDSTYPQIIAELKPTLVVDIEAGPVGHHRKRKFVVDARLKGGAAINPRRVLINLWPGKSEGSKTYGATDSQPRSVVVEVPVETSNSGPRPLVVETRNSGPRPSGPTNPEQVETLIITLPTVPPTDSTVMGKAEVKVIQN